MDRLSAMAVFVKIVEAGSLTAAARATGGSLAAVSRQLAQLEDRLGVRLLQRSTRKLSLTEGGRGYFERAKRILGEVEEAELLLAEAESAVAGRLVVSAPVLFGRLHVAPAIAGFLAAYPQVALELLLEDRYVDLIAESVDVAVRIGELGDSSLIARKLGEFRRVVCAAPDYLARHGRPRRPDELAQHGCLVFSMLADATLWHFREGARELAVRVTGRFRSSNADAVLTAAIGGAGIALAPSWQVREAIAAGRLLTLLEEFALPAIPIHALYPTARYRAPKIRAFGDHLARLWSRDPFAIDDGGRDARRRLPRRRRLTPGGPGERR
jgi:DNA-binding transcriptional LysR family regulator